LYSSKKIDGIKIKRIKRFLCKPNQKNNPIIEYNKTLMAIDITRVMRSLMDQAYTTISCEELGHKASLNLSKMTGRSGILTEMQSNISGNIIPADAKDDMNFFISLPR
jgi:hypothetical protein